MNSKLYKLIFCRRLGCLIAVGEFTRSYGRALSSKGGQSGNNHRRAVGILSRLAMMTGLALGTFPLLVLAHPVLPVNGHIVIGQGMLDQQSNTLTVTQQTDKLAINWASFDIAHGHSVIYAQPDSQSIALNQVQGQSASQIYGRLQANGQIFLLNPRGILFGKEAQVDVGGLVASTKYMSNPGFQSGDYSLIGGEREGDIINQANLRSAPGGYIALVGNRIDNQRSGSITTPQGKTVLAVGHSVTLNLDHGNLLGVRIQGETVAALIQNGGLIQADGGVIQLTAKGKDMLMDTVIDNTGILQAKGLSAKNGVIHLDGGGEGVVSQMGTINVNNQQGRGGRAVVEGKHIYLNKNSNIEAKGTAGGGTVLVGGGWQGKDNQIKNATAVVMEKGSSIDVSASHSGPGGTAVLWSGDYTGFHGNIRARGGPQSGDGGLVETSSQRNLQAFGQVNASAERGDAGHWLLDPAEVTIVGSGAQSGVMTETGNIPTGVVSNAHVFIPTSNTAQILNSSINTQLNSGTNVTVTTSNASLSGCQWCNITVQADITKTAGGDATLTLHADGNIVVNNNITADAGKLNLNLLAGNTTADSSITLNNSQVLLNGGDLVAKHANDNNTARISLLGGRYDVGNFTLDGNTALASQVGVNISNAANISVAGETVISGVSSNSRGQGWRGIDISNNSTLTGVGNMTFSMRSNSNVSWMGSFTNATITSDKNITFQGAGRSSGGVNFVNGSVLSKSGSILFDINGNIVVQNAYGLQVNNSQLSAKDVKFAVNVTGADGFLLRDSNVTATSGDINANATTINKGIWISGKTNLNASGNVNLHGVTTNSAYPGADAIKISGNSSSNNVNITADGNISLIAVNEGKEIGSTVSVDYANIIAKNGDFDLNISGVKGSPFNNATITANNISMNGNISANDAVVLVNTILTAKNDIKTNLNAPNDKSFTVKENSRVSAGQNISLVAITAAPSVEAITILGTSSNKVNITAGNDISITVISSSNVSGGGIGIAEANIETKSGNFTLNSNGFRGIALANVNLTANEINVESNSTGSAGWAIRDSNITATTGNITANGTSKKEGGVIKSNTTLNAKKDINLVGVTTGGDIGDGEGLLIQGNSESSRNNIIAQGNITLSGKTNSGIATLASVYLINTNLTSTDNDININGSSKGARNVYFTDVALNARAGNITVYSETQAALPTTLSSALSLGGNISIKAQNSSVTGKALNTILGSGVGFRANSSLSVEGNATFQGETEGTGATRRGIDFSGANTLNIAKGSKLFFLGENKGAQVTAGGNGITYTSPKKLTINNNGSLIMEGRSTSGTGINFPTSNDTIVLNGEGDTLIKGSSVTGGGVAISGVVNNSTGPVTIEGASTDGTGVHLFSGEHQINRINVTGISTQAEGLRISGNANITDTVLIGRSINSSGIKVDSLPGSSVTTHAVLDNASLNGSSTNGNGVEVTSDIKGIHQSFVNGTTDGIGYGIDIGENLNVTGTSEADLLILQGMATTGTGTGIKLNGNNDLSNTSLNSSAVDGIALDITGPLANQGNVILNGTASGLGIGAQVNGSLSDSVVNGTSANGIGVQINGSLENSRINGMSTNGSGVKVDGESVLSNTALIGNSTEGKGIEIGANVVGSKGSSVQGDVVNGTGVVIDKDVILTGGSADDLLAVNGNATGEKGSGVTLGGNNTLDNTTLSGNATDGTGIDITGPLTNNGSTVITGLADNGDGVQLDGVITGGTVNGTSTGASGIKVDGESTLDNATLNGSSTDGAGVNITADLTGSNGSAVHGVTVNGVGVAISQDPDLIGGGADDLLAITGNASGEKGTGVQLGGNNTLDNTTLSGNATDGTGVDITGPLTNSGNTTLAGKAEKGDGVQLAGAITGGTVNGTSDSGAGIHVDGETTLDNATLHGNSNEGQGVDLAANLSGNHGSAVQGDTVNGTGIDVGKDVTLSGGGADDPLTVSGNARGEEGTGVQLAGNHTLDNTSLSGNATDGTGVDITGPLTNSGNTTLAGKAEKGDGVQLEGAITGGTVNGTSDSGAGIHVDGETTLDNATLHGNSNEGQGVDLAANLSGNHGSAVQGDTVNGTGIDMGKDVTLSGGGADDPLTVSGNARGEKGTGVQLGGNHTLDNTSLSGNATDGTGVDITGPLTNSGNTTLAGKAEKGDGVQLAGAITGGTVNGTSDSGAGIHVDGETTLDNATLHGNSNEGQGVDLAANLSGNHGSAVQGDTVNGTGIDVGKDVTLSGGGADDLLAVSGNARGEKGTGVQLAGNHTLDNTTLSGNATDGTGVDITGPLTNSGNTTLAGKAEKGDGVQLEGAITGGTVNGTSDSGAGIHVDGETTLDNATLHGNSSEGQGVDLAANLSGNHGSAVQGDTVNGTGIDVGKDVTLSGGGADDLLAVSGNARGEKGTGVQLGGNHTLDNTTLSGNATDGTGVDITGPLTNSGNTTLAGKAEKGDGVQLAGAITGGTVNGTSDSGAGIHVDGETTLDNATLHGNSNEGQGVDLAANLSGNHGSAVQGDTVNGTGIDVGKDVTLSGGGADDLLAVSGNARGEKGTGVQLGGNHTLDNTTLSGNATDGTGVDITGPLTNSGNTTLAGKAEKGDGVQLEGAITGGTVNGTSDSGAGIHVDGETTLDNATLHGNSNEGQGVDLAANLSGNHGSAVQGDTVNGTGIDVGKDVTLSGGGADDPLTVSGNARGEEGTGVQLGGNHTLDNTTLSGNATDGTGVDITGPLTNSGNTTLAGKAEKGDGVQLEGAITGGTVNGTSDSGAGIHVDGETTLDNATLHGNSNEGQGVDLAANLSGNHGSAVQGDTVNGTGIDVGKDVTLSGGGADDPLTVSGNARGEEGTGVQLGGNHTLDNTTLSGNATDGTGVDITGPLTNSGNTTLAGKAEKGDGVQLAGAITGGTVNGTSDSGAGIHVDGETTLDNATLHGNSNEGQGVDLAANLSGNHGSAVQGDTVNGTGIDVGKDVTLSGGGADDPLTVSGNARGEEGTGVQLGGNHTLDNTSLSGNATDGTGVDITGPLTNSGNTTLAGKAEKGDGVQLAGAITGGTVNGTSDSGAGIHVDGETTLDNATLHGNSNEGQGVDLAANLSGNHGSAVQGDTVNGTGIDVGKDVTLSGGGADDPLTVSGNARGEEGTGVQLGGNHTLDNTSLSGNATDGTGVDITGPLTNSGNTTLAGKAEKGDGVQLEGAITGGTVNGTSDSGAGIHVDGETTLDNATLHGNSNEGQGVDLAANLSGNHGSAVQGDTVNGTGIDVGKDVTLSGGGADDPLTVSGNARGEEGTGVQLAGNHTLDNTSLSGNATDGHGVEINGSLINNGNTTINGKTSDDGHGVHINGAVSGGEINGHSDNSHGVFLDESALLNDIVIGGGTGSYKPPVFIALPETIGEHVTINGKPIDKTQPEDSKARESDNPTRGKYTPLPPVTDPVLPPASTDDEKNTEQTSTLIPYQKREDLDMLIMARNHILSTLEGRDLSSSVVNESEQSAAGVTGIMVCLPLSEASEHEPCDKYILDKGQPHLPMMVKK